MIFGKSRFNLSKVNYSFDSAAIRNRIREKSPGSDHSQQIIEVKENIGDQQEKGSMSWKKREHPTTSIVNESAIFKNQSIMSKFLRARIRDDFRNMTIPSRILSNSPSSHKYIKYQFNRMSPGSLSPVKSVSIKQLQ